MTPQRLALIATLTELIDAESAQHPIRVAVDGRTASGKTTLADEVATMLRSRGRIVIRTSVDGFHHPKAWRYRQGRMSAEGYLDDARDWAAVKRLLLDPLGPDGDLTYRTTSFDLDRDEPILQDPMQADPGAVLIVDGTFLQRRELHGAWDLKVLVEVAEEVAIRRGAARDAAHLGGEAAAREMHERRYQPAYAIYHARVRPTEHAHIVVNNDDPDAPFVTQPN